MRRAALLSASLSLLAGCGGEVLLHGLDERQANEVLVALGEARVDARKEREEGPDGRFVVKVSASDAGRAHRVLAERALPRVRAPGFAEVFGKGSMVPTPTEEHALYLHALGGELARSVEAIDGVVEARVHFGLPQADPLRPGARPPPRAAVLVRCRPAACTAVRSLESGIRALVAGAADGLEPSAVSIVVSEAAGSPVAPPPARRPSAVLLWLAGLAAVAAIVVAATGLRGRFRREVAA